MKQPELGKKITELRLSNGLTQSELAEKCNLSLRTIQRIETAEVTPRSYSIKLIFKNLNYDAYNLTNENSNNNNIDFWHFKKNNIQKTIILLIIIAVATFSFFEIRSNKKTQTAEKVTKTIKAAQANIKRWMNTGQIDSVLTMYRNDACVLQAICGKIEIREMLQNAIDKNYKLKEYKILSVNVGDTIAIEKYQNKYDFKGKINKQIGLTEWRFTKGKWLIINDVFREY